MVTTGQNPIIDTHTQRERDPNITLKIKSQGKRGKEERTKKELQIQSENN